jgi:Na+-transporting NADH:ubiquinone oxidoreductase subunit C
VRQSNSYIIFFMAITTFVIGGLLSTTSQVLRPAQLRSIELDTKSQILGGVMEIRRGDDVLSMYNDRISSIVVNSKGEEVETDADGNPIVAENVDIARQFRVPPEQRLLPVFMFKKDGTDEVEAYIFPVYGVGLWDNIWGYIALETDLETIRGVRFAHAGETPGLGARITDIVVQERFVGAKIYDDLGELVSVQMLRSERNPEDRLDEHHIDGMAGATITSRGVNDMIRNYFRLYDAYIQKLKAGQAS